MKQLLIVLLLIITSAVAPLFAQDISNYKSKISVKSTNGGIVSVVEDKNVKHAITQIQSAAQPSIMGYGVVIYMGNSGNARNEAISAKDWYTSMFPDSRCVLTYENPYFKVTVGPCISQEEAVLLMHKVQGNFPKSFVTRENIPIADFAVQKEQQTQDETSPTIAQETN